MNSGIGSAGALRQNVFAGEASNTCRQRALYGWPVGLDLPTGKIVSVVGQHQLDIAHQPSESSAWLRHLTQGFTNFYVWTVGAVKSLLHASDILLHLPDNGLRGTTSVPAIIWNLCSARCVLNSDLRF
jgi:hypothetical protein